MEGISDFFSKFIAGDFGFDALKEAVIRFDKTVSAHPDMMVFSDFFNSVASVMPYVTMGVMLLFLFFGKKLLPQIKFVCSFFVGFGLGVYFLAPAVSGIISGLPAWVSGLVVALLLLAINRFFYLLFFVAAVFFTVFNLAYSLLSMGASALISIAAVGVIIALVFKRYFEMLGTALLGAFVAVGEIDSIINFNIEISLGSAFCVQLVSVISAVIAVVQ